MQTNHEPFNLIAPADLVAEQTLLGTLLANNKAYGPAHTSPVTFLSFEHFADPIHGRIFQAIANGIDERRAVDGVTIAAELEGTGVLDEVGGNKYLTLLLTKGVQEAGGLGHHIYECWVRRTRPND